MAAEDGTSATTIIDMELALPPAFLWPECCIYKIPKELRMLNEKAYSPRLISIGPFHHGKRGLKKRDMLKLRYFRNFFYRTQKKQEDFYKLIDNDFHRVLRSYSEFDLAPEDLLKVILLDAIFIIELFLNTARNPDDQNDEILSKPWLRHAIRVDLMLLENQIPYFVLKELYEYAFMDDNRNEEQHVVTLSFLKLTYNYFCLSYEQGHMEEEGDPNHFTDLLRTFHCRPFLSKIIPATRDPDEREIRVVVMPIKHLYSATKLAEAGVKFKAVEENVSFLDIKFQKNSCLDFCPCFTSSWLLNCLPCLKYFPCMVRMQTFLEVPHLVVDDRTETLFRNIMALEECHYPREAYFCNYVSLLDFLISDEKDVELLVDKKVIRNQLGSNAEVATLINNLCPDQIGDASSIYYDLSRLLNKHCDNPWNRTLATMSSVYFPDIWRGTATVVGLIILGFTFWNFLRPYVS
ncbi:UPF0481 protein At3g47200-like [Juglans microcarpa x Juglans regia]|uniref:UPF0481 protein At3g47200-like n=1 Tax=Juglans microcarpa x Juglans regia TaxID=2249226 RepID=UPI001B7ED602|nr:UPF0481 protein At3g47200-like [Juglans microcarpa x Juglans regia]